MTLLVVDVQANMFDPPVTDAARVGPAIADLLARARAAGEPVVHVRHNGGSGDPDFPGTAGWQLVHAPLPGEPIVDKHQPSAFEGTNLAELLPVGAITIVGMQSDYCIRATTLAALERGYTVTLGPHATYGDGIAETVSAELRAAGAI